MNRIDRFTDAVVSATDRLRLAPHKHVCPQCSVELTCNNPTGCPGEYARALCGACVPVRRINAAAERQYIAAEQHELSAADRAEYNEYIDQQWESYWDQHCPQHSCPLSCAECEHELLEERRAEGFLERHE